MRGGFSGSIGEFYGNGVIFVFGEGHVQTSGVGIH